MDGRKTDEADIDNTWALQRLAMDWSAYDLAIYADGLVMNGTEIGGGGILVIDGLPNEPSIHHSNAIHAGT